MYRKGSSYLDFFFGLLTFFAAGFGSYATPLQSLVHISSNWPCLTIGRGEFIAGSTLVGIKLGILESIGRGDVGGANRYLAMQQ